MGAELGFEVIGVGLEARARRPDLLVDAASASCSAEGDVAGAAALLGRPHEVRGTVVEQGDRRGRELGFPTANVAVPARICLPADGIYAGTFTGARRRRPGWPPISLGRRPTFYEHADMSLLEAYVLDFDGDLYGDEVRCASWSGSGARSASTPSRPWWRRCSATSRRPGRLSS